MPEARLEVTDALGRRVVPIAKTPFTIGRAGASDLRLAGSEVSRDHAEIVIGDDGTYILKDHGSRYGTYVNGEQISECQLTHSDRVRLGRGGGADLVFLVGDDGVVIERSALMALDQERRMATLLEELRTIESSRPLDDVLTLVLDWAIEAGVAERGFIMLSGGTAELEFNMARARSRAPLPSNSFATSRKIPEEVFRTGEPRLVADLLDGDLANVHMGSVALGIRNVLCVPIKLGGNEGDAGECIGVLYLDSRERGSLLSSATRAAIETLATEAAVAIERARAHTQMQDLPIGAATQKQLLPEEPPVSSVLLGASLPPTAAAGDEFTARFVAYEEDREDEIASVLGKLSPRSVSHLGIKRCRWQVGASIQVRLSGSHLTIAEPEQTFAWDGISQIVDFDVAVRSDAPCGNVVMKCDVSIAGIRIATIRIDLSIGAKSSAAAERLTTTTRPASTAFAWYSTEDRLRVLDRLAEIQRSGLDVFMDCLSMHPGEAWKDTLKREIERRELFLLFWSASAKQSEWVEWEWRTALQAKGLSSIDPHPLDPVFLAEPPDELKPLHFGDPYMLTRRAYERP